jgi:hypothetical protein
MIAREISARAGAETANFRSRQAARPAGLRTIHVDPWHIRPGETLVMEFRGNRRRRAATGSPVRPCTLAGRHPAVRRERAAR